MFEKFLVLLALLARKAGLHLVLPLISMCDAFSSCNVYICPFTLLARAFCVHWSKFRISFAKEKEKNKSTEQSNYYLRQIHKIR